MNNQTRPDPVGTVRTKDVHIGSILRPARRKPNLNVHETYTPSTYIDEPKVNVI